MKLLQVYRTDIALAGSALGMRGSSYIKSKLKAFSQASEGMPHIIMTDLDNAECAPALIRQWTDSEMHRNCLFRIAAKEVDAWLLADREGFAAFIRVRVGMIPENTESIPNPKEFIIQLAQKSRKKIMKDLIPIGSGKQGPGYNVILQDFVKNHWNPENAKVHNRSLSKMIDRLNRFLL